MAGTSATKELIPHSWKPCFEARGIDAHITNAGLQFDTTAMMLERIDRDVPNGTDIEWTPEAWAGEAYPPSDPPSNYKSSIPGGGCHTSWGALVLPCKSPFVRAVDHARRDTSLHFAGCYEAADPSGPWRRRRDTLTLTAVGFAQI